MIRSAVLPVSSLTPFLSLSATSPLRRFISTNAFLISPLGDFSFPLFSPFLCSLLARAPFRGSVPSLLPLPRPPVFQPFYPEPRWERCIYIYISDARLAARLASPARRVGNVMQINDKSEMVDVNKNLTRRKNWKGGRLFCEAKGCCCCFCRLDRRPIWNFSSAAITDTAICNFARDSTNSTFQTFIYPIYSSLPPPSSILHLSDYL